MVIVYKRIGLFGVLAQDVNCCIVDLGAYIYFTLIVELDKKKIFSSFNIRRLIMTTVTAYIEKDAETGLYVAIVPGIPGAHTQAETLDELQENLTEVLELCLEEMEPEVKQDLPQFVGIQQVEVSC